MKTRPYTLTTFLVVLSVFWIPFASAQTVNVPDAKLAAILRGAFNLNANQDITVNDLLKLRVVTLINQQIRDLTGLEHATNIERLILGSNQISDIRPISGLTKLIYLYLDDNQVSDISAVSGLTNLQILDVRGNQVSDISAVSGLTNLQILDVSFNRISDLTPLSQLTTLTWLSVGRNPITDLRPVSNLVNLTFFVIDPDFDEKYPGQLRQYIPANAEIVFLIPNEDAGRPVSREELRRKPVVQHCGFGWSPQPQYTHHLQRPKVMIYALEFEYKQDPRSRYICSVIEIRTGDPAITDLDGWKLYLGTRYNPSYVPIELTQANSQINNGVLRLTPEMLGLERFACSNIYFYGQALPSVRYDLKNENNATVDRAYSCYLWGQVANTQVNGIWKKSERRISSQVLRAMETPRIERYIIKPNSVYITYMPIEDFRWDRAVLSDWLLPATEESQDVGGNAPSLVYKQLTTSWAALKKEPSQ